MQKAAIPAAFAVTEIFGCVLERPDVFRLPTLLAFGHREFNRLAFFKAAIAIALDRREMHEYIFPALARDKTETLSGIEPLNCTLFHFLVFS